MPVCPVCKFQCPGAGAVKNCQVLQRYTALSPPKLFITEDGLIVDLRYRLVYPPIPSDRYQYTDLITAVHDLDGDSADKIAFRIGAFVDGIPVPFIKGSPSSTSSSTTQRAALKRHSPSNQVPAASWREVAQPHQTSSYHAKLATVRKELDFCHPTDRDFKQQVLYRLGVGSSKDDEATAIEENLVDDLEDERPAKRSAAKSPSWDVFTRGPPAGRYTGKYSR